VNDIDRGAVGVFSRDGRRGMTSRGRYWRPRE
jgi:hypothetical protein